MLPIIDTHQHLWDLQQFHVPWLQGGGPLATNHVMADYLREADGLNIVQTVYMEIDVNPLEREKEAEYVLDVCRKRLTPMSGAVIGGSPDSPEFAAYIKRFTGTGYIKGVRQVLHGGTDAGHCLRKEFVRGVHLLGKDGLRFDLCLRPEELQDGAKLAAQCPETRFILDHCGNPKVYEAKNSPTRLQWKRDLDAVAKQPNVMCKISGIVAQVKPGAWSAEDLAPIVDHCVNAFGQERVLFASDWPVCTLGASLREWIIALQQIVQTWPEPHQRKLFHDNARRFYNLQE